MEMNLKMYLCAKNIRLKDFAKSIGCNYAYMSSVSTKRIVPSKKVAKKVEEATGGLVKLEFSESRRRTIKEIYCTNCGRLAGYGAQRQELGKENVESGIPADAATSFCRTNS